MKDLRDLLEVGRVVETRDGNMGFVLKDRIICKDGWYTLIRFDEELKHEFDENGDIVVVYDSPIIVGTAWNFESENKILLRPVWERKEFELSDVEKVLMSNIDNNLKYITRDFDGTLFVFGLKPERDEDLRCWFMSDDDMYCTDFSGYKHLFQFVTWENKEPVLIANLLE